MLDITVPPGFADRAVVDVLIIGTGFGGMAMAMKLRAAGFDNLLLIEKSGDVGGTWRDNTYPGCACDIPSHLYSLSFEQKADWSRMYPQQPEIYAYLRDIADKHGLRRKTRFNTEMMAAAWDEQSGHWEVSTSTGRISARVMISGMGALHIPAYPKLPGLERFRGRMFHSASWDHDYDLAGKTVAVVGTGASAIQFVPQIAPKLARLDLYQRTPPWVIPKPDRAFSRFERALLKLPLYRHAFRKFLFLLHDIRVLAFQGKKRALKIANEIAMKHMTRQVPDPVLRAKLMPNYRIGCKRLMLSNDYYPALARNNVDVITHGIAEVRENSILDVTGVERAVDAIIFGTGFEVTTSYRHTKITGIGGQILSDLWDRTGMEAYQGVTISGFPNYFMLLGPHSALGHNSVVIMIEAQVDYIVDALKKLRGRGARAIKVAASVQNRFIADLQENLRGTVWQDGGCESWYKDKHGKVSTIWPGSAWSYQRALRTADLRDYEVLSTQTTPETARG